MNTHSQYNLLNTDDRTTGIIIYQLPGDYMTLTSLIIIKEASSECFSIQLGL